MVLVMSVVSALIMVGFGWISQQAILESQVQIARSQMAITQRIAEEIDAYIENAQTGLVSVANTAPLEVLTSEETARDFVASRPGIRASFFTMGLFVADERGHLIGGSSPLPTLAVDPSFRRWVDRTVSLQEPIISPPLRVVFKDKPLTVLLITAPIFQQGDSGKRVLKGILVGAVDVLAAPVLSGVQRVALGNGGYFFMTTWNGLVLLHPDPSMVMHSDRSPIPAELRQQASHGMRAGIETVDQNGQPVLSTFTKLQSTGWVLGANYPLDQAYGSVSSFRRQALLTLVAGVIVAALCMWVMMRLFVRPIRQLAQQIQKIEFSSRREIRPLPLLSSADGHEIRRVGLAINQMIDRMNEDRAYALLAAAVYENVSEGIVVTDPEGNIVSVNPSFTAISGYTFADVKGRRPNVLKSGEHPQEFYDEMWQGILYQGAWRGEVWNQTKSGSLYLASLRVSVVRDERGEVLHYIGVLSDVTERKQAESALQQSELRLSMALSGANDGLWDWDLQRDTTYASPRWWQMMGVEGAEPPLCPRLFLRQHLNAEDVAAYDAAVALCLSGGDDRFEVEYRVNTDVKTHVWILSRGQVIRGEDGAPVRMVGIDTDLTTRKQMEESLRSTSARLKLVLDNAAEGIYGVDMHNIVVFANVAAATLLGWSSPQEMLGLSGSEALGHHLVDGRPCAEGDCPIRRTLSDGVVRRVSDEFFAGPRGVLVPVEYVVAPLIAGGEITGVVTVFHDTSVEKQRAEEIRRLLAFQHGILTSAGNAIIATDGRGLISLFNPAAEDLLGVSAADVILKQSLVAFLDPQQLQERADALSAEREETVAADFDAVVARTRLLGRPDQQEWTLLPQSAAASHAQGGSIPVLLSVGALPTIDGASVSDEGYIVIAQDISALKELEKELKSSNTELEHFAYVASHDLRQPLRMVTSYLTLIERRLKDKMGEDEVTFIGFAVDGARQMDRMINGLLEYSRIGRTSSLMTAVDLQMVFDRLLRVLAMSIEEAHATVLLPETLPTVYGSASELERLFQNLLTNALKFRLPDRPVQVSVSCQQDGEGWRISVTDNGIGIEPDQMGRLFSIFQRLVSADQYEGTGIGLASCRKIVEYHGGRIWVESRPEEGSTFHVFLPNGPE